MPRQTFISKDFFVNASEEVTKQMLIGLPTYLSNVKLMNQNIQLPSLKFIYERNMESLHQHVNVSILPLSFDYTKITLQVTYLNGHAFRKDSYVSNTLQNFEAAIKASINGSIKDYEPSEIKQSASSSFFRMATLMITFISIFIFKIKSHPFLNS